MAFPLAYLKALQQGSLPVSYAGFMMVGYGGIGKSSLLCGLKNQPLPDVPSSTLMADCHMISGHSRPSQSSWTSSKGQAFWKDVTEEEEYIEMARLILQARKSLKANESLFDRLLVSQDQENPLLQREDVRQIVEKVMFYASNYSSHELDPELWIRVWDCGGQRVFRTILPAFITQKTMFLLMFDARDDLYKKCASVYRHPGIRPSTLDENLTVMELILKWMATIHASLSKEKLKIDYSNPNDPACSQLLPGTPSSLSTSYPKIIPVGTHGDDELVKNNSEVIIQAVTEACKGKSFASAVEKCIIVDNTTAGRGVKEDSNYDVIRKKVSNFAEGLSCNTPITWVLFRKVLSQYSKSKPIATISEIHEAALACTIPEDAINSVLHFYHSFGVFFHYKHIPSLQGKVIIDPQWLVEVIAALFPLTDPDEIGVPDMWLVLRQYGLLVQPLYEDILSKQKFLEPREIIDLLSDFLIIGEIHSASKKHHYQGKEYFVPCMLSNTESRSKEIALAVYSPAPLHLVFSTNYLPPGFFTRFSAILSKIPMFEVLFDEICHNKIRYAYGMEYERAEEITIYERVLSVQVDVEHVNGNDYQEFFYSCREILEQIRLCSDEVLKWLPGIKMKAALQCHKCPEVPTHFTVLPTSLSKQQKHPKLRCQRDRLTQLNPAQKFWIAILLVNNYFLYIHLLHTPTLFIQNDPHKITIQEEIPDYQSKLVPSLY